MINLVDGCDCAFKSWSVSACTHLPIFGLKSGYDGPHIGDTRDALDSAPVRSGIFRRLELRAMNATTQIKVVGVAPHAQRPLVMACG
jgi:hypothetical protein